MKTPIPSRERGAVLIVALIFLVILTMLGVTAMTGTSMELRMSSNSKDLAVAMHAAEAAVRDAENDIQGLVYSGSVGRQRPISPPPLDLFGVSGGANTCNTSGGNNVGLCVPPTQPADDQPLPADLVTSNANISFTGNSTVAYGQYTGAPQIAGVSNQPHYVIEALTRLSKPGGFGSIAAVGGSVRVNYYRITARGFGANPNSMMTVSEVFMVP